MVRERSNTVQCPTRRRALLDDLNQRLSFGAVVGDLLQPTHLLFVLVVALLVLGPKRLPEVGRALGRGLRDFRSAISGEEPPEPVIPPTSEPVQSTTSPQNGNELAAEETASPADASPAPSESSEPVEPVTAHTGSGSGS